MIMKLNAVGIMQDFLMLYGYHSLQELIP